MSRYAWVAMTYVRRLRFWIFAACYVAILISNARLAIPAYQVMVSANLAAIGCCLVALHVRRQFGTPTAHLLPGFAHVHLTVAALASALGWLAVPATLSARDIWPAGAVAIHAVPGLLLAAAACWPKVIAVLAALPFTCVFSMMAADESGVVLRLTQGQESLLASGLILAAVAAHAVAARRLVGLTDVSGSPDEELVLEPSVAHQTATPWHRWVLTSRDAAAASLLTTSGDPFWKIRRWRVPVVVSRVQLLLPVLFAAIMIAISIWRKDATWSFLAMLITACLLFVSPFSAWHWRRRSFATELLLPVARRDFVRQIAIALAVDVGLWALVASATSIFAIVVLGQFQLMVELPQFLKVYLPLLWGMAVLVYGMALVTIRFRYWILLITILSGAWLSGYLSVLFALLFQYRFMERAIALRDVYVSSVVSAVVGLLLAWFAYRRLLEAEWR